MKFKLEFSGKNNGWESWRNWEEELSSLEEAKKRVINFLGWLDSDVIGVGSVTAPDGTHWVIDNQEWVWTEIKKEVN